GLFGTGQVCGRDERRDRRFSATGPAGTQTYCSSTVTVAGFTTRTVTGVPDGKVASFRPPAITAAVPAPAPTLPPIPAPFAPPQIPPMMAPPIAPPPIFAALSPPGPSPSR